MDDDAVRTQFDAIEHALRRADPRFVDRAQRAARLDKVTNGLLAALLNAGSIAMVVGLALHQVPVWVFGICLVVAAPILAELKRRAHAQAHGTDAGGRRRQHQADAP